MTIAARRVTPPVAPAGFSPLVLLFIIASLSVMAPIPANDPYE
jgi:hypothetical protein